MVASAAKGFSYLVGLQLFSRITTFALNTLLARDLGPQWYAIANVHLYVIGSTALFLAKEGLRRAGQRIYPGGAGAALRHGINVAWLSVPTTALVAALTGIYFADMSRSSGVQEIIGADEWAWTVWAVCAAAVVEACAEPGWLYAQANMHLPERIIAEGGALTLRAGATVWLALHVRQGARAFGAAQLVYACTFAALLYGLLRRRCPRGLSDLLPRASADGRWAPPPAEVALARQVCWQAAQKYILTEGERLILLALAPLVQQGAFALVGNLGSLVARLLLQPLEEIAFAAFSRLAGAPRDARSPLLDEPAARSLSFLLRAAAIFGGLFLCFGPAYSWLLVRLVYGASWSGSEAPALLQLYCAHVCAMSLNGLSEAFVHATATRAQLGALNRAVLGFSLLYIALALHGMHALGSRGLLLANTANLLMRTAYSFRFIHQATRRPAAAAAAATGATGTAALPIGRFVPHPLVLGSLLGSAAVTNAAGQFLGTPQSAPAQHAMHVLLGVGCLLGVAAAVVRGEREMIAGLRSLRQGGAGLHDA